MSTFLSGAGVECGPSNVLKNVSTRVDRDASLYQDRLVSVPNVAGSSKQPFRPLTAPPAQTQTRIQTGAISTPFDLSSLRNHLVPTHTRPQPQPQQSGWADAFHAQSNALASQTTHPHTAQLRSSPAQNQWQKEYVMQEQRARSASPSLNPGISYHQRPFRPTYQASPPPWVDGSYHPQFPPVAQHSNNFSEVEARSSVTPTQETIHTPSEPLTESQEVLARTARSFVDELDNSSDILMANPKLAQSNFMSLLRGLGSEEVVVQDDEMVDQGVGEGANFVNRQSNGTPATANWAGDFISTKASASTPAEQHSTADDSQLDEVAARSPYPQGTKMYPSLNSWTSQPPIAYNTTASSDLGAMWERQFLDQEALVRSSEATTAPRQSPQRRKSVHFNEPVLDVRLGMGVPNNLEEALSTRTGIPGAGTTWEDGSMDDLDVFDQETFTQFNGTMRQTGDSVLGGGVGAREHWGELQSDWEAFQRAEPATKGIKGMGRGDQVERYLFQGRNPYTQGMDGVEVGNQSPTLKGILELEAAVQIEPTSREAWYALGLKQQENEREDQAILALSKVVQLDPDYRPAYLALAVSYTNEGESEAACTMIERWIRLVQGGQLDVGSESTVTYAKREELIENLINIARQNPMEVDADVQEALGVLFNASEDYDKAEDCFLAALAVKPDDWLLYNRLGATLANSGRSNEAIQYYHTALSIHPNFVRALFNLSISYINLGQYPLAAQSALDALRLQHSDASEGYGFGQNITLKGGGVTSTSLWNTLRGACLHLNRNDLAEMVERRDLSGFPMSLTDVL